MHVATILCDRETLIPALKLVKLIAVKMEFVNY